MFFLPSYIYNESHTYGVPEAGGISYFLALNQEQA